MPKVHKFDGSRNTDHMTPFQDELDVAVEWWSTPKSGRVPSSQAKLAKELGVSEQTLRNWKRDPRIASRVSGKVLTVLSVEDLPDIVDTMRIIATDPEHRSCIAAGRELLSLMEKATGMAAPVPMAEMSDGELKQLAADLYDAVDDRTETA